jgi:hypothetical protein
MSSVSIQSIAAMIFFLFSLVIMSVIINSFSDTGDPMFGLLVTLFIGAFLSLLTCLGNMNSVIQINKKKAVTAQIHSALVFTTCPDYWKLNSSINSNLCSPHLKELMVERPNAIASNSYSNLNSTIYNEAMYSSNIFFGFEDFDNPEKNLDDYYFNLDTLNMGSNNLDKCAMVSNLDSSWFEAGLKCQFKN